MKKTIIAILALLLLTACGGAQTETQTETPADIATTTYENTAMGITFEYPETWVTADSFGGMTVASSQDVIDGESLAEIGDGGFVVVLPIERQVLNFQTGQALEDGDAMGALTLYKSLLEREGQTYVMVQPPESIDVNGQAGSWMVVRSTEDGTPMLSLMGALSANEQVVLFTAAAQQDSFPELRPLFEGIINSMQISTSQ